MKRLRKELEAMKAFEKPKYQIKDRITS